jgi:hypothetical protein
VRAIEEQVLKDKEAQQARGVTHQPEFTELLRENEDEKGSLTLDFFRFEFTI